MRPNSVVANGLRRLHRDRLRGRPVLCSRLGTLLVLVLFAVTPLPVSAQELTPRDIAARTRSAVVLITALADGAEISQGSGFLVSSDGLLVTNRHVVEGADALRVQLSTGEIYDQVYYVSDDERRDLAVLRIPATGLSWLGIGDDQSIAVGDPVYVMGNPLGLEGTFSNGLVSGKRMVAGVRLLQISAPISPGSSGGPVLDAQGDAIGIATLILRDGQNLNLAVPARYAKGLLALGERPRPFAEVAARFAADESRDTRRTAAHGNDEAPEASVPEDEELPRWAQVLVAEMESANELADDLNLIVTHKPFIKMVDEGETYPIEYTFDPGHHVIVGVCDIDCPDLDLSVFDRRGNLVEADIKTDSRPVVRFDVPTTATFEVRVHMVTCNREPCGFAVQAYRRSEP